MTPTATTTSAAPESPSLGGGQGRVRAFRPLMALLWKEWRQQRWITAGVLLLALALFAAGAVFRQGSFVLSGAAGVFTWLGLPVLLSARAFAGEDEDGTAAFLRALPFTRWSVHIAKMTSVIGASWCALGVLLLAGLAWPGYPDNVLAADVPWQVLLVILALAPASASQAALLASLRLRSLITALVTGVLLVLWAALAYVSVFNLWILRLRGFPQAVVLLIIPCVFLFVAAAAAERHPRPLVQFSRVCGACLGIGLTLAAPTFLSRLYTTRLASPMAWLRPTWLHAPLSNRDVFLLPRPTQKPEHALLACEMMFNGRDPGIDCALVDVSTGKHEWLRPRPDLVRNRWHDHHKLSPEWSPDGSRIGWWSIVSTLPGAVPPYPFPWLRGLAAVQYNIRDLGTGKTQQFLRTAGAYFFKQRYGLTWYDNQWLVRRGASDTDSGVVFEFIRPEDGSVHSCPAGPDYKKLGAVSQVFVVPGKAAVLAGRMPAATKDGPWVYRIARATPESTQAAVVNIPGHLVSLHGMDAEGAWALLATLHVEKHDDRLGLVNLDTGEVRDIELPDGIVDEDRRGGRRISSAEFVPQKDQLFVTSRRTYGLYDIGKGAWSVHHVPGAGHIPSWRTKPVVSPDGQHVVATVAANDFPQCFALAVLALDSGKWTLHPAPRPTGSVGPPAWSSFSDLAWLGNTRILLLSDEGLYEMALDGTARRIMR